MKECDRPPNGWKCTRGYHADGPCAAVPETTVPHNAAARMGDTNPENQSIYEETYRRLASADAPTRDADIWRARKAGETVERLGERFGLRREKVTQICELARASEQAACDAARCRGGVHEPPCPQSDPQELALSRASASAPMAEDVEWARAYLWRVLGQRPPLNLLGELARELGRRGASASPTFRHPLAGPRFAGVTVEGPPKKVGDLLAFIDLGGAPCIGSAPSGTKLKGYLCVLELDGIEGPRVQVSCKADEATVRRLSAFMAEGAVIDVAFPEKA